jgi:hypothetical protein
MSQIRITKKRRTASAGRRGQEPELPLDPRDPDITAAKQLQRASRRTTGTLLDGDDLGAGPGVGT